MQQVADWLEKLGLGQYVERFEPLKGCSTLAASSSCSRPGEPNGTLEIMVALFTDWSEVRRLPLLIVAGSITLLSSILVVDRQVDAQTSQTATGHREDSSDLTAVVNSGVKDKIDLGTISKAIVNEASRLKNDVVGWDQKLHELDLDLDLKKRKQDFQGMAKDIDECLAVLRAAANRLAPDAEARETFRKQESALREVASRAEVQSDPAIRSTAAYFPTEDHRTTRIEPVS